MQKGSKLTCFIFACAAAIIIPFSSPGGSPTEGVITVKDVEGVGETQQKALVYAFQNAIRKALGSYVISSAQYDGESYDEQIFINADAVVKHYDVVEVREDGNLVSVLINAEIVRNEMMKYIKKTVSSEVGEGELANLLAKRNAVNNAVKSLELLFMNWRENVYRVEKYGNLAIAADDDAEGDTVMISVPFIITFNWQAYAVFLSKLRNILSRIAIEKTSGALITTGDYSKDSELKDRFNQAVKDFYVRAGLAKKDQYDNIDYENSSNYGGVVLLSHEGEQIMRYELYIVPQQIKKSLESILDANAEIRFSLTSKGGGTIASRLIPGEVRSYGWSYFNWFDHFAHENLGSEDSSSSYEVAIISDKIRTEFRRNWSWYDEWTERRLFRATISVPLSAATKVAGCSISVQPMSDEGRDGNRSGDITSQTIPDAEWARIDGKPRQKVTAPNQRAGAKPILASSGGAETPSPTTSPRTIAPHVSIKISDKDKTLKARVDELGKAPPDASSAGKWFKLSGEVESRELRQEMLKATGAALVYAKKADVYQAKVRPQINDVSAFEETFFANCPTCGGSKTVSKRCATCSGDGACHSPGCRNGGHLVRQIQGTHWEPCRECKGTGQCKKCGGTGNIQSNCPHCKGRGKAINPDSVAEAYRNCVACIEEAFL